MYERGRPDYPAAAIAEIVRRLDLRRGRRVLDLAAGTGKLTRLLVPSGATVVAVEPVPEMRAELELRVPGIEILDGTAEHLPLAAASVDGVTVGQAFHWFRPDAAFQEIHRVLRPAGGLALIWNARDERHPLQAALSGLLDPYERGTPRRNERNWKTLLANSELFDGTDRLLFEHVQEVDEQGVVDRILSISFIAAGLPDVRADVERRVRELVRDEPRPIRLPYMTELYLGFAT